MKAERILTLVLLFVAQALFLWMFLASEGLEEMARAGHVIHVPSLDARKVTFNFTSDWRHGMSGQSFLYMPGFFLISIATWLWGCFRRDKTAYLEWIAVLACALAAAIACAPMGTRLVADTFVQSTGSACYGETMRFTWRGVLRVTSTMAVWSLMIHLLQRSQASGSYKWMWIPIPIYYLLDIVFAPSEPVPVTHFISTWRERFLRGDLVAIASFLMIPTGVSLLFCFQRRLLRSRAADGRGFPASSDSRGASGRRAS